MKKTFEAVLNEAIARIERYHNPIIELEEKRVQMYTTLSAGAIVASLTIFQAIGTTNLDGKIWLALTWLAFVIVIVYSLATSYDLAKLRTYGIRLMSRRQQALEDLLPQWSIDLLEDIVETKVNEQLVGVDAELSKHNAQYQLQLRIAGICFLLGICFFVVFGLVNLF